MLALLPSLLTCGNLAAGFVALSLAAQGLFAHAAALVAVAAVLDLLDGATARLCSAEGELGRNLDSLADVVSFGAVPAFALYWSTTQQGLPSYVGLVVSAIFLTCGAARLARFPLVKRKDRYLGLPIPPAGLAVALIVAAGLSPVPALAVALALGALMVSRIPFPSVASALRACGKALGRGRDAGTEGPLRGPRYPRIDPIPRSGSRAKR